MNKKEPITKIAGVGINPEELPKRNVLVKMALKSREYYHMDKDEATVLINAEIDKSGLYKKVPRTDHAAD